MEYKIEQPITNDLDSLNRYRDQLIALGIDANLLPLKGIDYARIHRPLRIARSPFFYPYIEITEMWQITMLNDPMQLLTNPSLNLWFKKDNLGFGIGHYATWSGKVEALDWILNNQEDSLDVLGMGGLSIGHFASLSGSTATLEWVLTHRPHLLPLDNGMIQNCIALSGSPDALDLLLQHCPILSDDDRLRDFFDMHTFVFYIAQSGSVEALYWVLNHRPKFLDAKNKSQQTIVDFAAESGSTDVWDWLVKYRPEAMKNCNQELIFNAAISGSALQLNRALSLQSNPEKFVFDLDYSHFYLWDDCEREKLTMIINNTLNAALKTNYTLKQIGTNKTSVDETQASIQRQLNRNIAIKQTKMECISFFQGFKIFSCHNLPLDILECLLHVMLPQGIDVAYIKQISNEIKSSLSSPALRATALINKEIARLMPNVSKNKSVFSFFTQDSDLIIQALTALVTLIADPQACVSMILNWESKYINISKDKETSDCIQQVKRVLGVEDKQVNSLAHVKALS
jgi:hypothetical protein